MQKRKICVVSGSRADYGLLYWLMKEIKKDPDLILQIIVTGMHLERRFGLTYKEIIRDGFKIGGKVNMRLNSDTDQGITKSVGLGTIGFGRVFKKIKPDIVVILGDRFEMLSAASAALLSRIPIAHIHGGEITEGSYDDAIRHAITKMSHLHFAAHQDYARRIIQMGEDPRRVFAFGAPNIDSIKKLKLLTKKELEKVLDFKLDRDVALVTYHPVTMEKGAALKQTKILLKALDSSGLRSIFTMPNADSENRVIFREIETYVRRNPLRAKMFTSLGQIKYFSLLKYVGLMLGNSSSGIIEAPSFRLPVVNIGSRQKGRIKPENVIDVAENVESIRRAIKKATSQEFRTSLKNTINPFKERSATKKIINILKIFDLRDLKKGFFDLK